MPWKETSPGHFERPLDSTELFFKTVADGGAPLNREHYAITVFARIELSDSLGDAGLALQHAWRTMRYDHPQIASVAQGDINVYEVPNAGALDEWMAKTFLVASAMTTADDMLASFRPSPLPTIHYLPHSSEILIHLSHWRIDGIGVLRLLDNFFKALAEPRHVEFGDEGKNLSPGLDEIFNLSPTATDEEDQAALRLVMEYAGNVPSIGLPTELTNNIPGNCRRSGLTLPADTVSAIVGACRARDLSVTTALHAALILATQKFAPHEHPATRYTSFASFDFRPYLPSPYNNSAAYPVSVYFTGLPISITPSDFSGNASQLKGFYKQLSSPPPMNPSLRTILAPYVKKVTALLSQPSAPDMPGPTEPNLDSLGVIDHHLARKYGDVVEVTDFWLNAEMLTRQLLLYVWTREGTMTLSICYNEEFYKAEFVRDFVETVKSILLSNLDIQPGSV